MNLFAPFGRTIIYSGKALLNKELRSWTDHAPKIKPKTSHVEPSTVIRPRAKTAVQSTGTWT